MAAERAVGQPCGLHRHDQARHAEERAVNRVALFDAERALAERARGRDQHRSFGPSSSSEAKSTAYDTDIVDERRASGRLTLKPTSATRATAAPGRATGCRPAASESNATSSARAQGDDRCRRKRVRREAATSLRAAPSHAARRGGWRRHHRRRPPRSCVNVAAPADRRPGRTWRLTLPHHLDVRSIATARCTWPAHARSRAPRSAVDSRERAQRRRAH